MSSYVFLLLLAIFSLVAIKVEEWATISALGFDLEVPLLYLTHRVLYAIARWVLFVIAALCSVVAVIPWYVGIVATCMVAMAANVIAHRLAFNTFRRIHRFLAETESDPSERAGMDAGARITNAELKARLLLVRKHRSQ
jgi:hypothetical protein